MLTTAFLGYVRVLLFLQGLYLLFLAFELAGGPAAFPLVAALPGLAGIVTAVALRRGRRWAAIAAIVIEALWAAAAAAIGYETLRDWPVDWPLLWQVSAAAALFLLTLVGLLLSLVRAYAGLVRR